MTPPADLAALVREVAVEHDLHPLLVAALVEQESSWRPAARRYEAHYRWLIVPPDGAACPTARQETNGQKTSWGLCQVMGAVARELGLVGPFEQLLQPRVGLTYGCRYLRKQLNTTHGDIRAALSRYNSGRPASAAGLRYADQVLERVERMRHEDTECESP